MSKPSHHTFNLNRDIRPGKSSVPPGDDERKPRNMSASKGMAEAFSLIEERWDIRPSSHLQAIQFLLNKLIRAEERIAKLERDA